MKRDVKWLLALSVLNLLVGQVVIFGENILCLPVFLACVGRCTPATVIGVSAAIGSYLGVGGKESLTNIGVILLVLTCAGIFRRKDFKNKMHSTGTYALLGTAFYIIGRIYENKDILTYSLGNGIDRTNGVMILINIFATGIIAWAVTNMFSPGVRYVTKQTYHRKPTIEEMLSISILLFFAVKAVNPVIKGSFDMELTLVYGLMLLGGCILGGGAASVIGAMGAIVYNLVPVEADLERMLIQTGIFAILGVTGAILLKYNTVIGGISYIIEIVIVYLIINKDADISYMFTEKMIGAGITATILVCMWKIITRYKPEKISGATDENGLSLRLTSQKLEDYSKAFEKLSDSFEGVEERRNTLARTDMENVFRLLSANVCAGCDRLKCCWEDNYYATYADTLDIIDNAWKNGKIESASINPDFLKKCCGIDKFIMQIEMAVDVARLNIRRINRILETKEVFKNQFLEVAKVFDNAWTDTGKPDTVTIKEKQRLSQYLEEAGLEVKEVFATGTVNKRIKLVVECKSRPGEYVTVRQALECINAAMDKEFMMSEGEKISIGKEYERHCFYENTNYKVMTGVAKVTKSGEKNSGDNYSFTGLDNGEVIMMLCDGMGSGQSADISSRKVVELMENLMEAGFTWQSAVNFINCIYAWGEEAKDLYALDMGLINLYTGTCSFIKEGAFATFIKRKNWVEAISSTSLPGGIFVQAQMDVVEKKLYNGDFVIMVSDGVGQCLKKGEEIETMEKIIGEIPATNPSQVAEKIIEKCVEYNNYVANDDMTVLVLSIWNK